MLSAVFPRSLTLADGRLLKPRESTFPGVPGSLLSRSQAGKVQVRSVAAAGRSWTESYPPLRVSDPAVQALRAWTEWAYSTAQVFTITHLDLPGSGRAPNGVGGGSPVVNGASQTGTSLATSGWTASVANVVRAGDVFRIAGLNTLFTWTDDGNSDGSGHATLSILPMILVGSSPANGAAITRTGCTLRATLAAPPAWPNVPPGGLALGFSLSFVECV